MFELPDELGELDAAALETLLAAARDEAQALLADVDADTDLDRLEFLANAIDTLSAAIDGLEVVEVEVDVDADRTERAAALAARFATTDVEDVEDVEDVQEEEPIVAAAKPAKPFTKAKLVLPQTKTMNSALVAAANMPGVNSGSGFTNMRETVPHMVRAWDSLKGAENGTTRDIFQIVETFDPQLVADGRNDQEVINYAINQSRLADGAGLLAAGGWCAPAEQRYDICNLAALDGLLDLPTISVPRGSISYFRALTYSAVNTLALTGIGAFTNAQLLVDPPVVKPCVEIPCVSPVTFTLDVVSFCVRAGILQHRAFPELIDAWMSQALIAYQHYLNARRIAAIVALATANNVVTAPASFGAVAQFLSFLELQAVDIRFDHGMAADEVVEGFAPFWLPSLFRADLSRRANEVDWNFTRATLDTLLAARGIRLQWVKDFIDTPFTGAADVTTWPGTVNVVLYPAGAYLNAADPIIRVGGLQDSTLLQTNREQLLFVETAEGIVPACGNGTLLTIPLCASGATAGAIATTPGVEVCPA